MKSSAKLILIDECRAMPAARAALAPFGLSHCVSQAKPPAAIAGPSESFVRRGRNPEAATAWPFQPTVKGENDVII